MLWRAVVFFKQILLQSQSIKSSLGNTRPYRGLFKFSYRVLGLSANRSIGKSRSSLLLNPRLNIKHKLAHSSTPTILLKGSADSLIPNTILIGKLQCVHVYDFLSQQRIDPVT